MVLWICFCFYTALTVCGGSINVKIKVPNCVHVRIPNSYQHK